MHRKFIAFIIAAALAVTVIGVSAAPARADSRDVAKILGGLAILGIIGSVIKDRRDDRAPVVTAPHRPRPPVVQPRPPVVNPRPLPPHFSRYDLPQSCLRDYSRVGGPRRLLAENCLRDRYAHVTALPRACEVRFRDRGRIYSGFDPHCLREHGYRVAGN